MPEDAMPRTSWPRTLTTCTDPQPQDQASSSGIHQVLFANYLSANLEQQRTRLQDLVGEGHTIADAVDPETLSWEFDISDADFKKLQVGFRSFGSDYKWHFVATGPDEAGNIRFHIIRIFSRMVFFALHIKPRGDDGDGVSFIPFLLYHYLTWGKQIIGDE
ncbi:hypothetical protein MAPG_02249 [Magnaporthiopsis poae ATCC 64411]|uniref:Uncharacterized protein n=1 Tax=Magnaporthiopsis poae (strain ATCC 64411 / 73-15) TaxID=644358 RepID=A0A0C4DQV2_MAGP6|nr:hypothetical protein MAPG_02249 [Magnaporthiopsis poae ATCC 64411]